jgi:hypothetical protein
MSDFMKKGDLITVNGYGPLTVEKWQAEWSIALRQGIPHVLWILFEEAGESKKYVKFISDNKGEFAGLELLNNPGEEEFNV